MILYHVSYNTEKALDYTFIPRVPESIAFDEDDQIKRICFADSIKNCIIAKEGRLMQGARDIIVYKYEVDEENSNIISWKKLYEDGLVNDASLTHEYWYVGEEPIHLIGKKYRIIQKSKKEQMVIESKYRKKMLEVLECSEFNQEYYIKLPTYQLLDLINRNDKLIEIAKERVGHWDRNKDYDAELDELLGEGLNQYEWKIDWDSLDVIEELVISPL